MRSRSTRPYLQTWYGTGPKTYDYRASASASSGLPVTHSIDPASAGVCQISQNDPPEPATVGINFAGPGSCTLHANQTGNQNYLPAPQATQSFVLDKVQPKLTVLRKTSAPGRQRILPRHADGARPRQQLLLGQFGYPGQLLTFAVRRPPGRARARRTATASRPAPPRSASATGSAYNFSASYEGNPRYKPVSRKGPTFSDKNPVQPPF